MSEPKHSFIVVAYEGHNTAIAALETLHELAKHHEIKIRDAVVVYKDEKGKIKLHPKNDMTATKGGVTGMTAGLIIGTILGGPLLGAAVGAATGAIVGNISGLDKDVRHLLEEKLGVDDSALCALVKYAHWDAVRQEMARFHGQIITTELKEEDVVAFELLAEKPEVATAVTQVLQEPEQPQPEADKQQVRNEK